MKEAKTIGITVFVVVLVLLVAGLGYKVLNGDSNQAVQNKQALSNLRVRIGELNALREEQTLTRDIMIIQREIRELTLKAQTPPVIEGTFIPMKDLPKEMQD